MRCNNCHGPESCDCDHCVENADFDSDGLCVCNDKWSGYTCTEWVGYCDHKCIGCNGPSALDCDGCVPNAFRNSEGECECDFDWKDEDCSVYAGQCHIRCENGCFGPLDSDCIACVVHSEREIASHRCLCKDWWTGEDCSYWRGECAPTCIGCNGPDWESNTAPDIGICEECVAHAHRDNSGQCDCDEDWDQAEDCSAYIGPCSKNCSITTGLNGGCYGPTEYDCYECVFHSHRNEDGICTCDKDWGDANDG